MANTVKKAKAAAKPKKAATKTKAAATTKAVAKSKTAKAGTSMARHVTHEEIEKLAHQYWAERGHQHGQPELDWFRAERELRGKAS